MKNIQKDIEWFLRMETKRRNGLLLHARVAAECARRTFKRMETFPGKHPQWLRFAFNEILDDLESIVPETEEYKDIPDELLKSLQYGLVISDQRDDLLIALSKVLTVGFPRDDASSRALWKEAEEAWEKVKKRE
jgi:hypothetical protein